MSEKKEGSLRSSKKKSTPKYLYLDKFERFKSMINEKMQVREKASFDHKKEISLIKLQLKRNKRILYMSTAINIILFVILFGIS